MTCLRTALCASVGNFIKNDRYEKDFNMSRSDVDGGL